MNLITYTVIKQKKKYFKKIFFENPIYKKIVKNIIQI